VEPRVELSIVLPVFNEEDTLLDLYDRLVKILDGGRVEAFELIFVDDGSTDVSFHLLREIASRDRRVRVVRLAKNFGQHIALSAGIERSRGDIVILMDADLQNAPEDIPKFVAKIHDGYDFVSGWRASRQEISLTRRVGSAVMNRVISLSTGVFLHDHGCGFKAMTRRVAMESVRYGHLRRFLEPLLITLARSVAEVPVADSLRRQGRSRYNFFHLFALTVDLLTSFSLYPFRYIGCAGIIGTLIGFAAGFAYIFGRLFGMPAGERLPVAIILLTSTALQFTILGLLGEYVVRTYHAAQNLPLYSIEEEIGGFSPDGQSM
jgi:glycosyltransferase involved in cell wall biosynthesis